MSEGAGRLKLGRYGLVYSSDAEPGILRLPRGRGFSYLMPDGTSIADQRERARIKALAVPPAYRDVWICPRPDGHLQATGRDERQRKQYRYHADWSALRAQLKFADLAAFGETLPRIRRRLAVDLRAEPGTLTYALAALVSLIDAASLRIGSREYLEENGSFGASTLQSRHVRLEDGVIRLNYKGKGGGRVRETLRDKRLHRILETIDDLPGKNLFVHVTEDGAVHDIDSAQVNEYLAEISGRAGVTAKTFRTWSGTLAAFDVASAAEKPTIKDMTGAAATRLHNTPAVCRRSYIHPAVLALAGERDTAPRTAEARACLRRGESRLLQFLEDHGDEIAPVG